MDLDHDLRVPKLSSQQEKQEYLEHLFRGGGRFPLMNGGMGIDFTDENFVNAMMDDDRMGVLSGAVPGHEILRQDLSKLSYEDRIDLVRIANKEALTRKIMAIRERHPYQPLGINLMVLLHHYRHCLEDVIASKEIDVLFVGAGMDPDLPARMSQPDAAHIRYVPIVSSARVTKIYVKKYGKNGRLPDGYYVELPQYAGGHLGYTNDEQRNHPEEFDPQAILYGIQAFAPNAPAILAGGIAYRDQIHRALAMGYKGVAMGTRLLLTQESGMPNEFIEEVYLNPEYNVVVDKRSPTGFWSCRLDVPPTTRTRESIREACKNCVACVGEHCKFKPNATEEDDDHYCIARDLSMVRHGARGTDRIPTGIFFTGTQVQTTRHDTDLHRRNGQVYIPTITEATVFSLTHDAPNHEYGL